MTEVECAHCHTITDGKKYCSSKCASAANNARRATRVRDNAIAILSTISEKILDKGREIEDAPAFLKNDLRAELEELKRLQAKSLEAIGEK